MGVPFLNLDALLFASAPSAIPGFDLFLDQGHFTPRGNYAAAFILLTELRKLGLVPTGPDPAPDFDTTVKLLKLTPEEMSYLRLLQFINLAFFVPRPEFTAESDRVLSEIKRTRPGDVP